LLTLSQTPDEYYIFIWGICSPVLRERKFVSTENDVLGHWLFFAWKQSKNMVLD